MTEVRALECGVGRDTAELALKEGAKARLDTVLSPLRQLARAWSGAVMLGAREADDEWLALARCVADRCRWPDTLTHRQNNADGSRRRRAAMGSDISGGLLSRWRRTDRWLRCGALQPALGHRAAEGQGIPRRLRSVDSRRAHQTRVVDHSGAAAGGSRRSPHSSAATRRGSNTSIVSPAGCMRIRPRWCRANPPAGNLTRSAYLPNASVQLAGARGRHRHGGAVILPRQ